MRTDAASAEPLKAHDATETTTKKPNLQDAHGEQALTHHTLTSQEQLARPANWASMAEGTSTQLPTRALGTLTSPTRPPGYSNMANGKRRRLREHDSRQRTNKEQSAEGVGGS
jgi:hypothetical protein